MNDKKNFYIHEKYFETEEEFWAEAQKWPKEKLSYDSFNVIMYEFKENIFANTIFREIDITNGQMESMMDECFLKFIENLAEICK